MEKRVLTFLYANRKGQLAFRNVIDYTFFVGTIEFYKDRQVFMNAIDIDRGVVRNFAVRDIIRFY